MERTVTLTLDQTGFLCQLMHEAFQQSNLMRAADGTIILPTHLHELWIKLASANNEMMDEQKAQNAQIQ